MKILARLKFELALMKRRRGRLDRSARAKRGAATAVHNAFERDRLLREFHKTNGLGVRV